MDRIHLRILMLALFFGGSIYQTSGQLSHGGRPLETDVSVKSVIPVIDVVSVPLEQLLMVPENNENDRLKHLYFARNFDLQLNPQNSGRWTMHPNGYRIWQIGIRSTGAYSLGLIFSKFRLEGEARLFIYNENRSKVIGALTGFNNKTSGVLPVSHLPGECIYIQLEVPPGQEEYGELVIGEVARAYLPVFADNPVKDGRFGYSGSCNVDINCPEGADWQDVKRSVCRIVIKNVKWCTGTLVNTTDLNPESYILTAAHCIGSQDEATKSIFYFDYESPECDGPDDSITYSISGSDLIATGDTLGDAESGNVGHDSLDFSLVKLSLTPPDSFNIYLAGWERNQSPAMHTTSIHHPRGDVKKISADFDPPVTTYHEDGYFKEYVKNSFWRIVKWDVATTEMGSSGAPLFDQNQRIVGLLTGGFATCDSSVNDYFTKFDYSWDYYSSPLKQLKIWLDPSNTGVTAINGRDHINFTEVHRLEQVQIYPNPGTGRYTVQLNEPASHEVMLSVYSISGEIVFSDRFFYDGLYYLDLDYFLPGVYIVRILLPDRVLTQKIIHQP